jgi:hypothetical protein
MTMSGPRARPTPTWHGRVLELLDDPVGQAVLRRDGLSRDDVMKVMSAAAVRLGLPATSKSACTRP